MAATSDTNAGRMASCGHSPTAPSSSSPRMSSRLARFDVNHVRAWDRPSGRGAGGRRGPGVSYLNSDHPASSANCCDRVA